MDREALLNTANTVLSRLSESGLDARICSLFADVIRMAADPVVEEKPYSTTRVGFLAEVK